MVLGDIQDEVIRGAVVRRLRTGAESSRERTFFLGYLSKSRRGHPLQFLSSWFAKLLGLRGRMRCGIVTNTLALTP